MAGTPRSFRSLAFSLKFRLALRDQGLEIRFLLSGEFFKLRDFSRDLAALLRSDRDKLSALVREPLKLAARLLLLLCKPLEFDLCALELALHAPHRVLRSFAFSDRLLVGQNDQLQIVQTLDEFRERRRAEQDTQIANVAVLVDLDQAFAIRVVMAVQRRLCRRELHLIPSQATLVDLNLAVEFVQTRVDAADRMVCFGKLPAKVTFAQLRNVQLGTALL